jgi:hypothetical protein
MGFLPYDPFPILFTVGGYSNSGSELALTKQIVLQTENHLQRALNFGGYRKLAFVGTRSRVPVVEWVSQRREDWWQPQVCPRED